MKSMNLLPLKYQKKLCARKVLRKWGYVWVLCFCFSGTATIFNWWTYQSTQSELQALQDSARPLRKLAAQNTRMRNEIKAILQRESILEDVNGISKPLSLVGVVSRCVAEADNQLLVHQLNLSQVDIYPDQPKSRGRRSAPPKEVEPIDTILSLTLSGISSDDVSIAKFVGALRHSSIFETVELKSSMSIDLPHGQCRKYDVSCTR